MNQLCAWWQASQQQLWVDTHNCCSDQRSTATVPVYLRYKVYKSHMPVVSLEPLPVMRALQLALQKISYLFGMKGVHYHETTSGTVRHFLEIKRCCIFSDYRKCYFILQQIIFGINSDVRSKEYQISASIHCNQNIIDEEFLYTTANFALIECNEWHRICQMSNLCQHYVISKRMLSLRWHNLIFIRSRVRHPDLYCLRRHALHIEQSRGSS